MQKITVDAMGKQCPVPVVLAKKQLDALKEPAVVEVHVDNTTAVENLKRLAESAGGSAETETAGAGHYIVRITAQAASDANAEAMNTAVQAAEACGIPAAAPAVPAGNTVCAFASAAMGTGDDKLGAVLMKGFIYALTQMEELPKTCLFYNGGARLTAEGSESLEDIRALEREGVKIMTCGTCADFLGIREKIAVGSITNMYEIVEKLTGASKVIRP